ncbi:hypothetical protein PT273_03620 [Orbaceae bacterium ESL0727]|nr:hypothetical protein [Orbaceae bacterium ESL0727]
MLNKLAIKKAMMLSTHLFVVMLLVIFLMDDVSLKGDVRLSMRGRI